MIIKHKGVEYKTKLKTEFNNYNCSVKMVGRLSIDTEPKNDKLQFDQEWTQKLNENKRVLITAWIGSLESRENFPELREGNKIFPNDNGRYLPSVLLFADAINAWAPKWYQGFLSLVREFQSDPTYGITVIPLPAYHNRTYGMLRFSRVYALFPPSMKGKIFLPNNQNLEETFKNKGLANTLPTEEDKKEYLDSIPTVSLSLGRSTGGVNPGGETVSVDSESLRRAS